MTSTKTYFLGRRENFTFWCVFVCTCACVRVCVCVCVCTRVLHGYKCGCMVLYFIYHIMLPWTNVATQPQQRNFPGRKEVSVFRRVYVHTWVHVCVWHLTNVFHSCTIPTCTYFPGRRDVLVLWHVSVWMCVCMWRMAKTSHQTGFCAWDIASFPGSHAPEREHWSCAGAESLVSFLRNQNRTKTERQRFARCSTNYASANYASTLGVYVIQHPIARYV